MFGGKSAEHEISLISEMNIIKALDRNKYEPILIGVDKSGGWFLQDEATFLGQEMDPKKVALSDFSRPLAVVPGESGPHLLDPRHKETEVEEMNSSDTSSSSSSDE